MIGIKWEYGSTIKKILINFLSLVAHPCSRRIVTVDRRGADE